MQQGVDRIDAVLDRVMDELGNPGARAEVAESIERSFEIFHRYDELSGRAGGQKLISSAHRIAAAITTLEERLHAVIAALSALENQLRTAQPSLVFYGFHREELDALIDATYPPRYSHGGSHV
jgi:iron-sulfur cluster repair protein YtfE (RIC family)